MPFGAEEMEDILLESLADLERHARSADRDAEEALR